MGNVYINLSDDLPVSYALGVELDQQVQEIKANPLHSIEEAHGRNIDTLFSHAYLTVNAVQSLERQIRELEAQIAALS